jgi:hypothetical protein
MDVSATVTKPVADTENCLVRALLASAAKASGLLMALTWASEAGVEVAVAAGMEVAVGAMVGGRVALGKGVGEAAAASTGAVGHSAGSSGVTCSPSASWANPQPLRSRINGKYMVKIQDCFFIV